MWISTRWRLRQAVSNALLNHCSEAQLQFHETGDAARTGRTGEIDAISADVIVANILAGPLIVLEPILTRAARPAARIALSGILTEQAEEVAQAYRHAFDIRIAREQDGWVLFDGNENVIPFSLKQNRYVPDNAVS